MNTHCSQGHPLTGNVYIDPRGWAHCKVCRRESANRYRHAHPGRVRESANRYRHAHPERVRESANRYRHAHPERVKEAQKRWRTEHREYCNATMRKWTAANPEKRAAIIWRYLVKKRAESRDGATKSQIA